MGCQFKYAVEDEGTTLEEYIAPVPSVILDDVVSLCFDPKIEQNKGNAP